LFSTAEEEKAMNKTQKVTVFLIAFLLVSIAVAVPAYIYVLVFKRNMPLVRIVPAILLAAFIGGFVWAMRKQSRNEAETDEMDIAIQKMAAIISFITVLVVMGVLLIIANLVWGLNFAVPLWILMLLFGLHIFIGSVVWCIAILIQYRRKAKYNE
jgi:peptidoglycan biosynthesis protein MviN/MurJ (putative lipid II flippase)